MGLFEKIVFSYQNDGPQIILKLLAVLANALNDRGELCCWDCVLLQSFERSEDDHTSVRCITSHPWVYW